jgi:hypothetical protein
MDFSATAGGSLSSLLLTVGPASQPNGPQFVSPTPASGTAFSPPNDASFTVQADDPNGGPVTLTAIAPDGLPDSEFACPGADQEGAPVPDSGSDVLALTATTVEVQCTVNPMDHSSYPIVFTATAAYGSQTLSTSDVFYAGDGSYLPTLDGFSFSNYPENFRSIADMAADYPASAAIPGDMFYGCLPLGLNVCASSQSLSLAGYLFYKYFYLPLYTDEVCFGMSAASAFLFQDAEPGQPYGVNSPDPNSQTMGRSSPLAFPFEGDADATIQDVIERYESRMATDYGFIEDLNDWYEADTVGNLGVFQQVQTLLQQQGAVVLGLMPSVTIQPPIAGSQPVIPPLTTEQQSLLENAGHTVVAYATSVDANGNDIISIYDSDAPSDNAATLTIEPSGGMYLTNNVPDSEHPGDGTGQPDEWQIVPFPDSTFLAGSSTHLDQPLVVSSLGKSDPGFTASGVLDQQHWIMDQMNFNLLFTLAATNSTPMIAGAVMNGSEGAPEPMVGVEPNTQGMTGEITSTGDGSVVGLLAQGHDVTVTETDSGPVGETHMLSIDPTGSVVSLSGASSDQQYTVDVGGDTTYYGREFTVSGLSLDPSDTVSVGTDPSIDGLTLSAAGAPREVQLAISQLGENASSTTVTALVPGGGQQAVISVGDWSDLQTSAIDETVGSSTTSLSAPPIVVNVTGTQVYGGTPTFTPGFGADPAGTAATVSGTLACSTDATPSSSVQGGPYTISNCSGLISTAGPITYTYGSLTVTPAPLLITATPSSSLMPYGGPVPWMTPSYVGLVNGDTAPLTPPKCATTATATSSQVGSPYATSCSGASDPDYTITYNNTATITVVPDAIVVGVTGSQVYGGLPVYTPSYTGVDWVGTDGPSVVTGTLRCSTSATASSPVAGSPYTISGCSGLSATNYQIVYGYGGMTVTTGSLTVTSTPSTTTMTYGGPVPAVTPTYTGLVNGISAPAIPAACTTTATATTPVAGSPYATSCSGASDPNYTITYTNTATISVLPRPIVVTVTGTQVYGSTPVFTASYSGVSWVEGDGPSLVTGTLKCSTSASASSPVAGNPYMISGCSGLSAANYSIGYSYAGLTVTPASTATRLTSSANPAVTGQAVTYTATVTSTAGSVNPSGEGSVTFMSGSTKLCSGAVVLSGDRATCTVAYPAIGSDPVTASYSGGSDFVASTSSALTQTVAQDATAINLSVSSATSLLGQQLTLNAAVSAVAPGSGVPTGTVTFFDGTTALGGASLNASGQVSLSTNALLPGNHPAITAAYSGDPNYVASTSAAASVTVTFSSCISGRHSGSLTVATGQSVCITGTVSGSVTVQAGGALAISGGTVSGSVTMTQPTAAMVCAGSISGPLSISGATGPVLVGAPSGCAGSSVSGAVTLSNDAQGLQLDGDTVSGAVAITDPAAVTLCGNAVSGALSVEGATGVVTVGDPPVCSGNRVSGAVTLSEDSGGVQLGGNTIGGSVSVTSNGTASIPAASVPIVSANKISGSLACSGNTPPPTDASSPNTVSGARSGQCGAAGF